MGIREVLSAREILLIIRGAGKEAAASALRNGLVDPQWPITFLLLHDSVTVLQGA
jgi:6-phosphogluconolactonase/glucosamine-6-phosphate isomerase/deaminase